MKHHACVLPHGVVVETGYHIIICKKLIDKILKHAICFRLRASSEITQLMADLSLDRQCPILLVIVIFLAPFFVSDGTVPGAQVSQRRCGPLSSYVRSHEQYIFDITAFRHSSLLFEFVNVYAVTVTKWLVYKMAGMCSQQLLNMAE